MDSKEQKGGDFAATIDRRLPRRDIVTVPEMCEAFDVSGKTVHAWIEDGRLAAVSYSTSPERNVYRATRTAVMELANKMQRGEV
jgi:predicted site-specific integrase-resolvase